MARIPADAPETEIDVPGSYHRYYGDDLYGECAQGGRRVPDEVWQVLRAWDRSMPATGVPLRRLPVRLFLGVAALGIMAALLTMVFG